MKYYALCAATLVGTYFVHMLYITVFYHRGLTHKALELKPSVRRFVGWTGSWVTGIDPKAWVLIHRLHHQHSDTDEDPHSPARVGLLGVAAATLGAYKAGLALLIQGHPKYCALVKDIEFPVSWANRRHWMIPYAVHLTIALAIGVAFGAWLLGLCYFLGLMSDPIAEWMVNSFGHAIGYRNFDTPDRSVNNTVVAWLVVGEGYQNNHHQNPRSANLAVRWFEVDFGYWLCLALESCGLLTIHRPRAQNEAQIADS